ncbi:MAG: hypothetical protein VW268_03855 [Rhodospirillaceae bacterium]
MTKNKIHRLKDRIGAHRDNAGHATEAPLGSRLLLLNGQVGCRMDGPVPDVVKLAVYVTDAAHLITSTGSSPPTWATTTRPSCC